MFANAERAWQRKLHPDLFRLHRLTEVKGMIFTSLGNHFLLDWPDRQYIETSRSATDEQIQQQLQSVLVAAQYGVVTYTAAISRGEQIIARSLREKGFPLVILLNNGFPKEGSPHEKYYKPGGVYFETCSQGKLLLLEPDEHTYTSALIQSATEQTLRNKAEHKHFSYQSIPISSQRYRFVALNEMCRLMCAA